MKIRLPNFKKNTPSAAERAVNTTPVVPGQGPLTSLRTAVARPASAMHQPAPGRHAVHLGIASNGIVDSSALAHWKDTGAVHTSAATNGFTGTPNQNQLLQNLRLAVVAAIRTANPAHQAQAGRQMTIPGIGRNASAITALQEIESVLESFVAESASNPSTANLQIKGNNGKTLIHHAVEKRAESALIILCELGVRPFELTTDKDQTPLHLAASSNSHRMVSALTKIYSKTAQGLDAVNAQDANGNTAVWIAARHNNVEALKSLIIDGQANVNQPNRGGFSPVACAAQAGASDAILTLYLYTQPLEHNKRVQVNIASESGALPTLLATFMGHNDAIETLQKCGADLTLAGKAPGNAKEDITPLELALRKGKQQTAALIERLIRNG